MREYSLVAIGETMASLRFPTIGQPAMARSLELSIAGAESNAAIACRRLGGRSAWVGRVGTDAFGDLIVRTLRAEDVDTRWAVCDPDAPTGLIIKERDPLGRSRVSYRRSGSAGSRLSAVDLDEGLIARADWVHVTGITLALGPVAADAVTTAVSMARKLGTKVSFDPNHRTSLWSSDDAARAAYTALAREADLIVAGAEEAALLVGPGEPSDLVRRLEEGGFGTAVLKLGPRGALGHKDGRLLEAAGHPTSVVDPVGAGDAFAGALLMSLSSGGDLPDALALANRAGAWAVSTQGDWEGLPTRAQLEGPWAPDPDKVFR